jgi:hypothetical protein
MSHFDSWQFQQISLEGHTDIARQLNLKYYFCLKTFLIQKVQNFKLPQIEMKASKTHVVHSGRYLMKIRAICDEIMIK